MTRSRQNWRYWRQKTGNQIANQLYQEGDYVNALQIYTSLATFSKAPDWQLPALYQVGLVYERLNQPQKALETYEQILHRPAGTSTNNYSPGLMALLDMARWRKGFVGWEQKADNSNRKLNSTEPVPSSP